MAKEKEQEKNQQGAAREKMSYDELNNAFTELHIGYQKLVAQHRKLIEEHNAAVQALQSKEFDYMSFFISMLLRVMEHPEMYDEKFIKWATANIQETLIGFAENFAKPEEENKEGEPDSE